jgi:hypothetical protein
MSTFSKTQNIGVFAQMNGINKIDIVTNPHTGKNFGVSDTGMTFRVSTKVTQLTRDLSVSYFTPEEDNAEPSWMIHPTGESNVQSTLAFAPASK